MNYLRCLQFGTIITAHIDGILTGKVMWSKFLVEEQTVWAKLLLSHTILAIDVGVALSSDGISSIDIWTT